MSKSLFERMLEDRYIGIPLNNIHCSDGATPDGHVVAWSTYVFGLSSDWWGN
jgi:hypothetical protein